ncbi:MAG: peptidase family protein [Thermoleophilia bacterium]|jgi:murein DD-endopeptidase MepM/ murein hydrolase activator NlpD|nr:peptidase family protein [Thermoleophilia bacterium]
MQLSATDPTPLRFPLRGDWFVGNAWHDPKRNHHWPIQEQSYAVDLVAFTPQTDPTKYRSTHTGDGTRVEQYVAWNRPVQSMAQGRVVEAVDGIDDMVPGTKDEANILGNHVIVAHPDGTHGLYAHLRKGSVGVGVGDAVTATTLLGRVGNSGHSTEPHLHLQLQDTPTYQWGTESLPMQFWDFTSNTGRVVLGELPPDTIVRRL